MVPRISQREASQKALEYLVGLARMDSLPDVLLVQECESQCRVIRSLGHGGSIVPRGNEFPCERWACTFGYGGSRYFNGMVWFEVEVDAKAGTVADSMGLSRCFEKPHRCVMAVKTLAAQRLAGKRISGEQVWLEWDRDRGEFVWKFDDRTITSAHRGRR